MRASGVYADCCVLDENLASPRGQFELQMYCLCGHRAGDTGCSCTFRSVVILFRNAVVAEWYYCCSTSYSI